MVITKNFHMLENKLKINAIGQLKFDFVELFNQTG